MPFPTFRAWLPSILSAFAAGLIVWGILSIRYPLISTPTEIGPAEATPETIAANLKFLEMNRLAIYAMYGAILVGFAGFSTPLINSQKSTVVGQISNRCVLLILGVIVGACFGALAGWIGNSLERDLLSEAPESIRETIQTVTADPLVRTTLRTTAMFFPLAVASGVVSILFSGRVMSLLSSVVIASILGAVVGPLIYGLVTGLLVPSHGAEAVVPLSGSGRLILFPVCSLSIAALIARQFSSASTSANEQQTSAIETDAKATG